MSRKDGKKSGKEDEATMYKNLCIEKDLEIIVMEDKCRKLETRSMHVEDMIESLSKTTDEKIKNLEEIVLYLNVEEAKKDEKISKLEVQVQKLETDMQEAIESLQKQLEDDKGHHEFQVNSLNLQLEAANVKLREMSDFAVRKAAMEAELVLYVLTSHRWLFKRLSLAQAQCLSQSLLCGMSLIKARLRERLGIRAIYWAKY